MFHDANGIELGTCINIYIYIYNLGLACSCIPGAFTIVEKLNNIC